MYKLISNSVEETIKIAKKLAKKLNQSDIVILTGNLGTGKTYFTKGILENFQEIDDVTSPTFTIVNEYYTNPPIYHFDVYRLEDSEEFLAIGGEEYLNNGISILEWGETILDVLPKEYLQILITKVDDNSRQIEFIPKGEKYLKYMKELFDENISS